MTYDTPPENGYNPQGTNSIVPFTLPKSGHTLMLKRVPPHLSRTILERYPPPPPPTSRIRYGENDWRDEPNPSSPEHEAALSRHNLLLFDKMLEVVLQLGVVYEMTEEDRAAAAGIRATMETIGASLYEADPRIIYLKYVILVDEADVKALIEAAYGRSQPTEGRIDKAAETFRAKARNS